MSEPPTCRLNKQDFLITRQQLQGRFNRSEFTLWLSWGTCFEANCFLLLSSKFWPLLFLFLCLLCFKGQPQQIKHGGTCSLAFFPSPSLIFFFFSGSHSRWINGSHLWPLFSPFVLILSSLFLFLPLYCSQMQGWMWLVLTVREASP